MKETIFGKYKRISIQFYGKFVFYIDEEIHKDGSNEMLSLNFDIVYDFIWKFFPSKNSSNFWNGCHCALAFVQEDIHLNSLSFLFILIFPMLIPRPAKTCLSNRMTKINSKYPTRMLNTFNSKYVRFSVRVFHVHKSKMRSDSRPLF